MLLKFVWLVVLVLRTRGVCCFADRNTSQRPAGAHDTTALVPAPGAQQLWPPTQFIPMNVVPAYPGAGAVHGFEHALHRTDSSRSAVPPAPLLSQTQSIYSQSTPGNNLHSSLHPVSAHHFSGASFAALQQPAPAAKHLHSEANELLRNLHAPKPPNKSGNAVSLFCHIMFRACCIVDCHSECFLLFCADRHDFLRFSCAVSPGCERTCCPSRALASCGISGHVAGRPVPAANDGIHPAQFRHGALCRGQHRSAGSSLQHTTLGNARPRGQAQYRHQPAHPHTTLCWLRSATVAANLTRSSSAPAWPRCEPHSRSAAAAAAAPAAAHPARHFCVLERRCCCPNSAAGPFGWSSAPASGSCNGCRPRRLLSP